MKKRFLSALCALLFLFVCLSAAARHVPDPSASAQGPSAGMSMQTSEDRPLYPASDDITIPLLTQDNFDYVRYADDHEDLKDAFGYDAEQLWQHFIRFGIYELREYHSTDPEVEQIITGFDGSARVALRNAIMGECKDAGAEEPQVILAPVMTRDAYDFPTEEEMRTEDPVTLSERYHLYQNPYLLEDAHDLSRIRYTAEEEAAIIAYYGNTLFAGDSVMAGFRNVCAASNDALFQSFHFLATFGYSVKLASSETGDGYHPPYRGEKMPLWESIPDTGADTLVFYLGMMDLSDERTIEEIIPQYEELIEHILQECPGLRIVLLSLTYIYDGMNRVTLSSNRIAGFNLALSRMAASHGWEIIDIAYPLSDGHGNLTPSYSLDEQTHLTPDAYEIWKRAIKAHAISRIYDDGHGGEM